MTTVAPTYAPRPETSRAETADRVACAGLWLLPVYGALLAVSTLTQQPDYRTDFRPENSRKLKESLKEE